MDNTNEKVSQLIHQIREHMKDYAPQKEIVLHCTMERVEEVCEEFNLDLEEFKRKHNISEVS